MSWVVVGDGPWGRALARRLARGGAAPLLVGTQRIGARVPKGVVHTTDLSAALDGTERVILAVPVARLEALLAEAAPRLRGDHRVLTAIRGLTPKTHLRPAEAVAALTAVRQIAVLAGAADPEALRQKTPAALVVGSAFPTWATEVQQALMAPSLRIYTNSDPIGVELASLMALVLGVALGIARAMAVGPATEATALTRAVAEMDRVVRGMGGRANTAYGLAGLGVITELAFDGGREPFRVGAALARGEVELAGGAFELRSAARALAARAARQRIAAPMVTAIDALFDGHLRADEAMRGLMTRSASAE